MSRSARCRSPGVAWSLPRDRVQAPGVCLKFFRRCFEVEDHLEDESRDREECERRQDIQNRDQDPPAMLLARHAAPELVELVGLGHIPSLPRFYFGLLSAFRPASVMRMRLTSVVGPRGLALPWSFLSSLRPFLVSVTTVASPSSTRPASISAEKPCATTSTSSLTPRGASANTLRHGAVRD